jgi:uncharacterized membrane protein
MSEGVAPQTGDPTQILKARVHTGIDEGDVITVQNDRVVLEVGDTFYFTSVKNEEGITRYVYEPNRLPPALVLLLIFIALTLWYGGKQGLRGVLALALSIVLILFIILPLVARGFDPLLVSILVSSVIIVAGSYITHGVSRTTSSAVVGMIATICVTGFLAFISVGIFKLTGVDSEEVAYLASFLKENRGFGIDLTGLLLGGFIVGLLGVLYDAAIGQSVTVEELMRAAPHMSNKKLLERALRVGREHIGALVNTLAIAYVGVSLPLLLLFYMSSSPISVILTREDIMTEIVRTLVGSIGLVLAVPITTIIAIYMLKGRVPQHESDSHTHGHSHSHGHIHTEAE